MYRPYPMLFGLYIVMWMVDKTNSRALFVLLLAACPFRSYDYSAAQEFNAI